MQRNPQALAEHYIAQIAASTGLTITVESVNVALLPPALLGCKQCQRNGQGAEFYRCLRHPAPRFFGPVTRRAAAPKYHAAAPAVSGAGSHCLGGSPVASRRPSGRTCVKAAPATSQPQTNPSQAKPAPAEAPALAASENFAPAPAADKMSLQAWIAQLASGTDTQTSLLPGRFRLAISQGEVSLTGADKASLTVTGLQCDAEAAEAIPAYRATRFAPPPYCRLRASQPHALII